LQILGGLRLETTAQSYTSAISASTPGKSGTIQYKDFLPSVHSKWALNKKSNLRASYYKGIARPALFEFIPAAVVGDYFTEIGNPYLKHTKASNYDLRFEHFMNADEQFLIGGFYKKIINPIEYSFAQIFNNSYYYAPSNFGTATNFGFELVFAKFYKKFGLSGNYTFTESQITTTKRTIEANGTPGSVSVTRPLQGQSKHIANVAVLYKNKKAGLDLRISWVYTGERINIVSAFVGMDYWQRPMQQFDFSGEKKIGKHLSVFVKATNLFNAQTIVEIRSPLPDYFVGNPEQTDPSRVLVSRDQFGRTYYAGLRFKL
jgi:TonB-dependent receptor